MEYRAVKNKDGKSVYVSINKDEVDTEFDTGVTKAELHYHDGVPSNNDALFSLRVSLSREYIDDTYHLTAPASDGLKVDACLGVGLRAYEEKQNQLRNIETVIATSADSRLRYIPRIDMTSV